MTNLRVAVVGEGLIGKRRAAALRVLPDVSLAATVDPVPQISRSGGTPHYRDLDDLPRSAYDAAVIAVPHDLSAALAASVLRAGKPILVEKPLGTSSAEARDLELLAAGLKRPSFTGYNYRYLPPVQGLIRAVQDGRLGTLRSLDMLIGHGGNPDSREGWKLDPVRAGGGVLLDPGVHLLDLLLRISPNASCTAVEATRGFWRTGIEEDVVMTFRSGELLASLRVSHIRWINTFRIEAFGEDGYAIAQGRGGTYGPMTLRIGQRWGWTQREGLSQRDTEEITDFGAHDDSLRDELEAVIAAWRSGELATADPHPATMTEARVVTELCDQLYARIA